MKRIALVLLVSMVVPVLFISNCSRQRGVELLSPRDGRTLKTNIPELAWSGARADTFEVWMDGSRETTITNGIEHYVPFPLGYGTHHWKVVAHKGGKRVESAEATFSIEDDALQPMKNDAVLLRDGWSVRSSHFVKDNGAAISQADFKPDDWYATTLPASVLTTLVRNGVYPNPYVGMQNLQIPDISDEFNESNGLLKYSHIEGVNPWKEPYWYRTSFSLPAKYSGKNVWLHFQEINYKANIWLNGRQIADSSEVKGIDHPFRFNVTDQLKEGNNYLAVQIFPPDHPGVPSPPPDTLFHHPGRNMGDGTISRDYTRWDLAGWDWIPGVRDRNMGITEEAYLTSSGEVKISDVQIGSDLQLPDLNRADVTLAVKLLNQSDEAVKGTLSGRIQPKTGGAAVSFKSDVALQGGEEQTISLSPAKGFDQLSLRDPKVWWPYDLGTPHLYNAELSFVVDGATTDQLSETFGIREIETYMDGDKRAFRINGKKVYAKGGNWVNDMMQTWTASRFEQELRYAVNSNLNFMRVWGPDGAPPEAFFEAADKYGIMIQQDFLFDFWGTFKADPAYRPPRELYRENSVALVKRLRNHPSIVMWCGGNEGRNPMEDMITEEILPKYDNLGNRVYLTTSNGDGLAGGGPYHTIRPEDYFKEEYVKGFNSEIGPSGMPVANSLYHFLPKLGDQARKGYFPLYDDWGYHSANDRTGSDPRKFSSFDNIVRDDYGQIQTSGKAGVAEYALKSQLVNYTAYRSSLEAINSHIWKETTGYALWKYNSAWPDIQWQIYDWYQQPHAGFYAVQSAAEPVHIQYNYNKRDISVVNTGLKQADGLHITARLLDLHMNEEWTKDSTIDLAANTEVEPGWTLPDFSGDPRFLDLKISDGSGTVVSKNFYWLDDDNNFRPLFELPKVNLQSNASITENEDGRIVTVTLQNNSDEVAFFSRLKLLEAESGKEILPTYWSDNYFSLTPGESIQVTGEISNDTYGGKLAVEFEGVNVKNSRTANL